MRFTTKYLAKQSTIRHRKQALCSWWRN